MTIDRIVRELRRPVRLGRAFDDRVMRKIRQAPRHVRRGVWSRLTTPRRITVTPLSWGLIAATLVLFAAFGVTRAASEVASLPAPAQKPAPIKARPAQRVQFVLVAPAAKKVAVVGDFNGWDLSHEAYQAKHRGGGVWSVTAPVPPGHHRYSFIVDDSVWVADPTAPRETDNDFGVTNSAIVVSEQ